MREVVKNISLLVNAVLMHSAAATVAGDTASTSNTLLESELTTEGWKRMAGARTEWVKKSQNSSDELEEDEVAGFAVDVTATFPLEEVDEDEGAAGADAFLDVGAAAVAESTPVPPTGVKNTSSLVESR